MGDGPAVKAVLDGKVAVVSGSGQSVGRAIAVLMAAEGARVVVNSRSEVSRDSTPTARDTARIIQDQGGEATVVYADVSTSAGGRALVEAGYEAYGSVDILVNNAGGDRVIPIAEMTDEDWAGQIALNLTSQFICTRAAVPGMRERGWGRIINLTSRGGIYGMPAMSAYAASKMGTLGFTTSVARELLGTGITVNALAPLADTVRMERSREGMLAATGRSMFAAHPALTPDHVAPIAVYLASEAAASVTGQTFFAAAGAIARYEVPFVDSTLYKSGMWSAAELTDAFPAAFGTSLEPMDMPPTPT